MMLIIIMMLVYGAFTTGLYTTPPLVGFQDRCLSSALPSDLGSAFCFN